MKGIFHCSLLLIALLPTCLLAQEPPVAAAYNDQIDQLLQHPAVKQAFALIEAQDSITVADNILLTEIEAPPFKEMVRAEKFADMLRAAGIDSVWIDSEGNVLALRKGTEGKRTVALDAHLDTVFPEGTDVSVQMRGDTIYAPGVGDDTRGLAMLLTIARSMRDIRIRTKDDVLFVGSVGEEGLGDLRGVKHLFSEAGPGIDAWISIDGGSLGRVNTKALGSHRYRVTFHGPGGHSWGAFGLANPHHALGAAIHNFTKAADSFTKSGPRTSYNVGVISGGTSVNSIPFESIMEVDMRSESPASLLKMDTILQQAVQEALEEQNGIRRRGPELTVTLDRIGDRPSGELSSELPLIQRAMAALQPFGESPSLTRGSTNSNIPISLGIPAVTIGRGGDGGNAHSLDEWYLNVEGYKAVQYALLLLVAEAGLGQE
ncbi:MAG: M20/M25/M40 family metallo-hydrolase [Saprospiraceae bacterium]|nr:M20/M25/M40 family metallo-hydrolase [Lewinella sp.]